ncbi:hypothetical protein SeLEV6574_g05853 [Synchytrium endobioticum]|uniref:UspA domain-containing protein n=1 Tax=Synchytrium endobioticum TaxID=286115 RepID=A0A507CRZ4_9FUNG|nr:hypothetical protein SeLEV6574_g05853 [Synchytrium endobioticum]
MSASISDLPDAIFEPAATSETEPEDHQYLPYPEANHPSQIFEQGTVPDHLLPHTEASSQEPIIPSTIRRQAPSSLSLRSRPRRSLLLGVNSLKESDVAFDFCVSNVAHDGDEVILCHLVTTKSHGSMLGIDTGDVEDLTALAEAVRNRFALRLASMKPHPRITLRAEVRICKSPKEELCHIAYEFAAEALIVGHRGSGCIKSMIVGSVADYCVQHSSCPVFVVRHTL